MLRFDIPGREPLELDHLVLDLNGTLCVDGVLLDGVAERLRTLSRSVVIYAVTADTRGLAETLLGDLPVNVDILPPGRQDEAKRDVVRALGAASCAAVGNGANDKLMLAEAALGVALVQAEGACAATLTAANVACTDIRDALDLLLKPQRLVATLRV